jgi:hypothetical protein
VAVADTPQGMTLKDHRDTRHLGERTARWVFVGLVAVLLAAGLWGLFGQRNHRSTAEAAKARLLVDAPEHLRGGLFYQARFTIEAREDLEHATVVLAPGWVEQMQINTIEPAPIGESSRDGDLALDFGHVAAGDRVVAYMQFEVNPTAIGRRSQDAELTEDETPIASVDRTVTIWP